MDFTGTQIKKVVRALKRRKMVSHGVTQGLNKLFYQLLPDGVICAYAAKGTPNGPPGFMQPALRSIEDTLKSDKESELTINVTAVLPLNCPRTNLARKINYAKGTKKMDYCCILFIRDNVADNTVQNADAWCTNLVRVFSEKFPNMNLTFGGNAANVGLSQPSILDFFYFRRM